MIFAISIQHCICIVYSIINQQQNKLKINPMSYYKHIDLKLGNIRLGEVTRYSPDVRGGRKDLFNKHVYTEMDSKKKEIVKQKSWYLNEEKQKETAKKSNIVKSMKEVSRYHDSTAKNKQSPETSKKDLSFNPEDMKKGEPQFQQQIRIYRKQLQSILETVETALNREFYLEALQKVKEIKSSRMRTQLTSLIKLARVNQYIKAPKQLEYRVQNSDHFGQNRLHMVVGLINLNQFQQALKEAVDLHSEGVNSLIRKCYLLYLVKNKEKIKNNEMEVHNNLVSTNQLSAILEQKQDVSLTQVDKGNIMETQMSKIQENILAKQKQLDSISAEFIQMKQKVQNTKGQLVRLREDLKGFTDHQINLKRNCEKLQKQLENKMEILTKLREDLKGLTDHQINLKRNVEKLQNQAEGKMEILSKLSQQINGRTKQSQKQMSKLQLQITKKKQKINEIQSLLNSKSSELMNKEKEIKIRGIEIEHLKSKTTEESIKLVEAKNALKEQQALLQKISTRYLNIQNISTAIQNQIAQKQKLNQSLSEQIQTKQLKLQAPKNDNPSNPHLSKVIEQKEAIIVQLQAQIKSKQSKLQIIAQEYEKQQKMALQKHSKSLSDLDDIINAKTEELIELEAAIKDKKQENSRLFTIHPVQ